MVEALIGVVVNQLISATTEWIIEDISQLVGVEKELKNMYSKFRMIQKVLDDAEKRSVKDSIVKEWLEELKDVSYDMDDLLDEWNTLANKQKYETENKISLPTSSSMFAFKQFSCFNSVKQVGWRSEVASRIKGLNAKVDYVFMEMEQFNFVSKAVGNVFLSDSALIGEDIDRTTTSPVNKSMIHGRDFEKNVLVGKVLCETSGIIDVISIVGVGGIGKTTLAKLVYNDEMVKEKFEKRIWVCVSDPFDEIQIAQRILEAIQVDHGKTTQLQTLYEYIERALCGHIFLLVLDDVWDEKPDKWDRLKTSLDNINGVCGSKILVTTRSEEVVRIMGTSLSNRLQPKLVSDSDCWSVISQVALQGNSMRGDELHNIGKKIAKKCFGLPLAAKCIGGLLRSKETPEEWRQVLESDIWQLEEVKGSLFPHLFLSYRGLPSALKRCFTFSALFPPDYEMSVNDLISFCMAHGYINRGANRDDVYKIGHEYFRYLVTRSFLQESISDFDAPRVSIHDLMHALALSLSGGEFLTISKNDSSNVESTSSQSSCSKSGKKVRHLFIQERTSMSPIPTCDKEKLRSCLVHGLQKNITIDLLEQLKVVRALTLRNCHLDNVPKGIGKLIHLRRLNLSGNPLKELPETMGDLYNLECLCLKRLNDLLELPKSIGKLINLRTLYVDDFIWTLLAPESLSKLANLQTLDAIVVKEGFHNLSFLKNLNLLRGHLQIIFEIDHNDEADSREAQLWNKLDIKNITFSFKKKKVAQVVLESLQPPKKIEVLKMSNFTGTKLPTWISSLSCLKYLKLSGQSVSILPPLGKLPCLEYLKLNDFPNVEFIEKEFLGFNEEEIMSAVAFPKLVTFQLENFPALREWEDIKLEEKDAINALPKLRFLQIESCRELVALPHRLLSKVIISMELRLVIDSDLPFNFCIPVEEVVEGVSSTQQHYLLKLKSLRLQNFVESKFPYWITFLNGLTELSVGWSHDVSSLPPLGKLPSLKKLDIYKMKGLEVIGRGFLGIEDNNDNDDEKLFCNSYFPKLEYFDISSCGSLKVWEDLKPEDDILRVMPQLQSLTIFLCSKLELLPVQLIRRAASLKTLNIKYCGISRVYILSDDQHLSNIGKVMLDGQILKPKVEERDLCAD